MDDQAVPPASPEPSGDAELAAPQASRGREFGPLLAAGLAATGRGLAAAGRLAARGAVQAWQAVDPDVPRHLVQLPLLSYTLVAKRDVPVEAQAPDGHRPLVYVHGLGGNRGNFLPMGIWLRGAGRRRAWSVDFRGLSDIDAMAERLAAFLRRVLEVSPDADRVDLVAHSLGGVVCRHVMLDHGIPVGSLVTLGSPHGGTWAARYANTAILRELRPDGPRIARLQESALPAGVQATALWSRADILIVPGEHARLPGAVEVDMTPFTHYSYLIDPRGFANVSDALSGLARSGAGRYMAAAEGLASPVGAVAD